LILGELFINRGSTKAPDRYIRQSATASKLLPWEVIWSLTCLFHDPGYLSEKIWATIFFACGIPNQLPSDQPLPEQLKEQLNDAWDVVHKQTAEDIVSLYQRLTKESEWTPPRFDDPDATSFHGALRQTYFDGVRVGHSLQSGIYLINYCVNDETPPAPGYDKQIALTACEIAALSMMFHDQHCRNVMRTSQVQPLSFEQLPYSSVLMFVDALQDDRRDITKNQFNEHGVLEGLNVYTEGDHQVVSARVCLQELPIESWPGRIEEYEDVTRWINTKSKTRFAIDYQSRAWSQVAGRSPRHVAGRRGRPAR
jgi:hypothetical protein